MEFKHYSVMLEECIAALNIKENGIYLDCTLGGCGHTRRILAESPTARVIGLDRDGDAVANARQTLADPRFTAYYDEAAGEGATAFLRDALIAWCAEQ